MKNGNLSHSFAVALIQTDHDGLCRAVPADLLAWCGSTAPELIGQFIFQLFSAETRSNAIAAWERIVASKEAGRFEAVLSAKGGTSLPVVADLAPARGISAITDHWIVALHPVSHPPSLADGELRLLRAELTETRRRADDQLGALKEEIAQIQRAKDLLLTSLEEQSKARISELEGEISVLRGADTKRNGGDSELTTLRTMNAEQAAQITRLNEELKTLHGRLAEASTTVPAVSEPDVATLRAQNLTITARLRGAEEELATLRRDLTNARDEQARCTSSPSESSEVEALRRELGEARATRDALLTGAQKELQEKLIEAEHRFAATTATGADAARREVETLTADLRSARDAHAAEHSTAERLRGEIAAMTSRLEEAEKTRTLAVTTLEEQNLKLSELERTASESSQFAQTAAREFKEVLRKYDVLALELTAAREESARQSELIRRAADRESELTATVRSTEREALSLRDERDTARVESARLERELRNTASHNHQTTNDVFERLIAEVTTRLNRILRLFFALPELRPEDPLASTIATARIAATDLVHSLDRIHDYWLIEADGLALRRENFGLRGWLSSLAALYEFKATQRHLTLTMNTDPEIPDVVSTDGARLTDALSQMADYIVETASPGSELTFGVTVLNATPREVRVSFDFSAPCATSDQTTAQQLSLSVAERIVKLLGGEFTASEAPGDIRRVNATLGLLRGSGAPVPMTPRSRRRAGREEIEPVPFRPTGPAAPVVKELDRTFGVAPSFATEEEEYRPIPPRHLHAPRTTPPPRGAIIIPRTTPTEHSDERASVGEDRAAERCAVEAPPSETSVTDTPPPVTPLPAAVSATEDESAPLRILLAEDNKLNQRMISDVLKTRGYTVVIAGDGREALTHLTTARFDLALIDCEMPTLDGYAATREIRAAEARFGRHTPIFAMTVYLDGDIEARCSDAGTDELLTKPVRADALFALIDRYFPNRRP